MDTVQELQIQTTDNSKAHNSNRNATFTQQPQYPRLRGHKWWFRISLYIIFFVIGISSGTLLGRLYYEKGGSSKWMVAIVQSAGFPLLIPLRAIFTNMSNNDSSNTKPKVFTLVFLYLAFGLLVTLVNLLHSYGLIYLPLSTYALPCASELAFTSLFSYILNSRKFTALIFNSTILLAISASLLAINSDSDVSDMGLSKEKYIIGFSCTLGACHSYSLHHSLVQLSFDQVIKRETFSAVLDLQLYSFFVASSGCIVGLFSSGEWKTLEKEMNEYKMGRVSYIMTLLCGALSWQISSIGTLGLVIEVSSLFSIVIGTLELPIIPILAAVFFHDKINGVKVIALLLAIWGFLSYMYQHYLDDKKAKADKSHCAEVSKGEVEIC